MGKEMSLGNIIIMVRYMKSQNISSLQINPI